jgi:hypothetical protein
LKYCCNNWINNFTFIYVIIYFNSEKFIVWPNLNVWKRGIFKKIRLLRFLVLWILFENRNLLKLMFKVELDNVYADLNSCKLKKRYWKY